MPSAPIACSRCFSHSTMPAGLADRPCIPVDSIRPTRGPSDPGAIACASDSRRSTWRSRARAHGTRARVPIRVALDFRLLPVASLPTIRIRGLPHAVLPALGGETPRMVARSRTPLVIAHRPVKEETPMEPMLDQARHVRSLPREGKGARAYEAPFTTNAGSCSLARPQVLVDALTLISRSSPPFDGLVNVSTLVLPACGYRANGQEVR